MMSSWRWRNLRILNVGLMAIWTTSINQTGQLSFKFRYIHKGEEDLMERRKFLRTGAAGVAAVGATALAAPAVHAATKIR